MLTTENWISIVGPLVLTVGTLAKIATIYRCGYVEGGLTGKVFRGDPDFRWRIGLYWVATIVWVTALSTALTRSL